MDLTRVLPRSLEEIQRLRDRAFALSTGSPEDRAKSKGLTTEANERAEALDKVTSKMRAFAEVNTQMVKFAEGLYKVRDALREVAVEQTAQTLKGMKEYRESLENLFGGVGAQAPGVGFGVLVRAGCRGGRGVLPLSHAAFAGAVVPRAGRGGPAA